MWRTPPPIRRLGRLSTPRRRRFASALPKDTARFIVPHPPRNRGEAGLGVL